MVERTLTCCAFEFFIIESEPEPVSGVQSSLDWADTHHDVAVLDEAGKRVGARRFSHSHDGLNELKHFLLSIATSPENLACIAETNHGLLITFLLEAGIPVYPVNPKSANQLRKSAGAKIGRLDLSELRRLEPDCPIMAELKTLTRDQDALIQTQTRLVNQLTAYLKEYYPAALHLFAKVQQRSALVFLQTYSTPQVAQVASVEEITATLRRGKHTNPTRVAPKIVEELHHPQLVANEVMVRAKQRLMLSLVKQLLIVIEDIATYDQEIRTLFLTHEDQQMWRSLPRAGKRLAPPLLAEWGDDRTRYADANSVQSLAGTAPVLTRVGFLEGEQREKKRTRHAMLSDITHDEKDIGGRDDVLRTSIAMDNRSVKPLSALESPASGGVSFVEPGDGPVTQLWLEPGERFAGAAAGPVGRDTTPTLARMVLSSRRQGGEEAAHLGGGKLFCALVALGAGVVARRATGSGSGAGCDDLGTTFHGVVCERAGAGLRHSGSVEGPGL